MGATRRSPAARSSASSAPPTAARSGVATGPERPYCRIVNHVRPTTGPSSAPTARHSAQGGAPACRRPRQSTAPSAVASSAPTRSGAQDAATPRLVHELRDPILTFTGQYTVSSALEFVARCHRDRSLLELLADDSWRKLAEAEDSPLALSLRPNQLLSTVTIYQRIGSAYDVEMFSELASNMRRIAEKGLVSSDVLTSLSAATGKKLAADMAVKAEQARPRMALAIGLMVLPLLLLILYPATVAISNAFR